MNIERAALKECVGERRHIIGELKQKRLKNAKKSLWKRTLEGTFSDDIHVGKYGHGASVGGVTTTEDIFPTISDHFSVAMHLNGTS